MKEIDSSERISLVSGARQQMQATAKLGKVRSVRRTLYELLWGKNPPYSTILAVFLGLLVLSNIVLMIVSTVDSVYEGNETVFIVLEAVEMGLFSLEYILRFFCCVEKSKLKEHGPVVGRLRWMVSFKAVLDFLATAPFIILLCLNRAFENGFVVISLLRVFGVLRLLKVKQFNHAVQVLRHVLVVNIELLLVVLVFEAMMYIILCTLLSAIEPSLYPSIPDAMYVGALVLIGVETPDKTTLSIQGKVLIAIFVFIGILFVALPTGILAGSTGIEKVGEAILEKKRRKRLNRLHASYNFVENDEDDDDRSDVVDSLLGEDSREDSCGEHVVRCPHCSKELRSINNND